MIRYVRIGVAVLAALSTTACATVLRGTRQDFKIASTPEGAKVTLSTGQSCTTPCKLKLKRKKSFLATFNLDGYHPQDFLVNSSFNGGGALAGNFILGGLVGAGVDASNGSLNTLKPNPLVVTLTPLSEPAPEAMGSEPEAASKEQAEDGASPK